MKRVIDLLLISIIIGAIALLLRGVPERPRGGGGVQRPLEIPRPRAPTATAPPAEVDESVEPPAPVPAVAPPSTTEPDATARPVPAAAEWQGYSYRGGDQPVEGSLPVQVEGSDPLRADAEGRFRLRTAGGRIALITPGERVPWIELPNGRVGGTITVHQYPPAEGAAPLLEPAAALLMQASGNTPRLLVSGRSTLPDGAELAVRLIAAEHGLESVVLRIHGGHFAGELPLSPREFHAGVYVLQFAWGPKLATRQALLDYQSGGGELIEGEFRRDMGVFFGTPEEARRQASEVRAFYLAALDDLEGMRDLLLVAGAQSRKKRMKLLDDPARVARMRAHSLASRFDRLFDGKTLQLDEWRRIIDQEIPARVVAYTDAEALPYSTKHPQAAHNLVQLAQHVRKFSMLESTVVYETLRRPRHANDFLPSHDFDPATERDITLERIETIAAAVRSYVGL